MKSLILIRHAKSDWGNAGLPDFDRPLNERGKKNAPEMAQRLVDKKIRIDAFVASPAKRAAKTAKIFIEAYKTNKEEIIFFDDLYLAEPATFFKVISALKDKYDTVAIFSHNNGITDFANQLTNVRIDNIPTCGVFAINIETDKWSDFAMAKKEFWFFDYPKSAEND
jgi:phosphohistidine phosphatase